MRTVVEFRDIGGVFFLLPSHAKTYHIESEWGDGTTRTMCGTTMHSPDMTTENMAEGSKPGMPICRYCLRRARQLADALNAAEERGE